MPVIVAINSFFTDTQAETDFVKEYCANMGVDVALAEVFGKGGDGGVELAEKLCTVLENSEKNFTRMYSNDMSIKDKINAIVTKIYGGSGVAYTPAAEKRLSRLKIWAWIKFPCALQKHSIRCLIILRCLEDRKDLQ